MSQKIVVESQAFASFIIGNQIVRYTEMIEITGDAIRFIRSNGIIKDYAILHVDNSEGGNWKGVFHKSQWHKIVIFLESLVDQKVMMEIYSDDAGSLAKTHISITEATMHFH